MARVKKTDSKPSVKGGQPTLSPEAQERRCIALAMNLAEQQLRDGTASSQLITEFVKRGSTRAKLEEEILAEDKKLKAAKTEMIQSQKRIEELYDEAISAMRRYAGQGDNNEHEDY